METGARKNRPKVLSQATRVVADLEAEVVRRMDAEARRKGQTRAEVVRRSVRLYLKTLEGAEL